MADLGSIGSLVDLGVWWGLGRNARSVDRAANPVRAILCTEQAFTASFQEDFGRLAGHLRSDEGAGLSRSVRVIHRATGTLVAAGVSEATAGGAFSVAVPPVGEVDLHLLAQAGDGCDLYLPRRTPA